MPTVDSPLYTTKQPGGILAITDKSIFPGSIFWVDDSGTDAAGWGRSPNTPVATLDYAISLCTDDVGDTIVVMAGHAETVGSVTVDISGVTIVGLGIGLLKPTFTFDDTTDEINVTAANVTIRNLRLVSSVNSLVNFIDADAANLVLEDIDFVTASATECVGFINFATTIDGLTIRGCRAWQPSDPEGTDNAAGTGFLYLVDSQDILIEDCIILGSFETAIVHNLTTKCQNLYSRRNIYRQDLNGGYIFELVNDSTGHSQGDKGHNINATDATPALCIGGYGTKFWFALDSQFSNDSAAGGQGMIASEAACT